MESCPTEGKGKSRDQRGLQPLIGGKKRKSAGYDWRRKGNIGRSSGGEVEEKGIFQWRVHLRSGRLLEKGGRASLIIDVTMGRGLENFALSLPGGGKKSMPKARLERKSRVTFDECALEDPL